MRLPIQGCCPRRWRNAVGDDASESYTPVRLNEPAVATESSKNVLLSIQDLKLLSLVKLKMSLRLKGCPLILITERL